MNHFRETELFMSTPTSTSTFQGICHISRNKFKTVIFTDPVQVARLEIYSTIYTNCIALILKDLPAKKIEVCMVSRLANK